VLEKKERLGGKIWSIQEEGYLCEWGPNGFLDNKPRRFSSPG
jgi:oxygen-dependent protoporphyrinogen oxidase